MKLSVIVPIYNEDISCIEVLKRVAAVPVEKEILVVDDGSHTSIEPWITEAAIPGLIFFVHSVNQGKGAAIQTALRHATGDLVIIQDADLEYYPEDYLHLLKVYEENGAQAVYGVRDLSTRKFVMRFGNWFVTWCTNVLYGSHLKDMETCYKLIDIRLMKALALTSRRFEIEAEISAKLLRMGVNIVETPIRYEAREEGKKLKPSDGFPTLAVLLRYLRWRPDIVSQGSAPVHAGMRE